MILATLDPRRISSEPPTTLHNNNNNALKGKKPESDFDAKLKAQILSEMKIVIAQRIDCN